MSMNLRIIEILIVTKSTKILMKSVTGMGGGGVQEFYDVNLKNLNFPEEVQNQPPPPSPDPLDPCTSNN